MGADEAEHNVVDAHAFLEGLCAECLEELEIAKAVTLEDIAHTEDEALNLVSGPRIKKNVDSSSIASLRVYTMISDPPALRRA